MTRPAERHEEFRQLIGYLSEAVEDEVRWAGLAPRLAAALGLTADASPLAAPRLDHNPIPTMLLDRDSLVLQTNRAAAACLERNEGLQIVNGRLAGNNRATTDRLRRLVARIAIETGEHPPAAANALPLPRDNGPPLTALVEAFRSGGEKGAGPSPAVLLFIADPSARPVPCATLQSLFQLTAAEAAIASALAAGQSLDEIAAASGISRNTVRAHLKNVFGKTSTCRQAQLVALLLRSVAGFPAS